MSQPLTLLIIDDSPEDFRLIERTLSQGGLQARCVRVDTTDMIERALATGAWDCVLSDYSVPKLNFDNVLERLRAHSPDLPVILVSGSIGEESAVDLLKRGVWDFVLKDSLKRLVTSVERSLREAEERRRLRTAEMALKRNQERLNLALTAAGMGVWEWDIATDHVYWSSECFAIMGISHYEGKAHDFTRRVHPADTRAVEEALAKSLATGTVFHAEFRIVRPDGAVRWIANWGQPHFDESGQPSRMVGTTVDITERKEAERELTQHRHHLEELVSERTAELELARRESERLAGAKSEFLATMSHEIRTPLNAVLGFAQLGQRDCEGRRAQQIFERILDSGQLLLGIVNDVLDFSKIEAGKFLVERGFFHPVEAIQRAADQLRTRIEEKGLGFRIQIGAELPVACRGDSLRVTQVIGNLLSNAIKFTERGGISLAVSREGDQLVFQVADTGIGMSEDEINRVFQPFEQADSSINRRFGGSGLGLSISKHLVDMMEGELRVTSQPGQGSLFEVRLPCVEEDFAALSPVDESRGGGDRGGGRLQGLAILVAEDYELNRVLMQEMLADEGCRLVMVENGLQAVQHVRDNPFDLVLMDIEMPEMDGYEAARRIARVAPDLPVVGLTAHALPEVQARCLAAGMVEHMTKPIRLRVLLECIHRHVRPSGGGSTSA